MHGYKVYAVPMGSVPDLPCDGREHDCPPPHVVDVGLGRRVVRLDEHYFLPQHRS